MATSPRHCYRSALLAATLLLVAAWGAEAAQPVTTIAAPQVAGTPLPGTLIQVASSEEGELLQAEASSTLAFPFAVTAPLLASAENWCQFMPLHFNIKACTFERGKDVVVLTLYSGRKGYQSPEQSQLLVYRFDVLRQDASQLSLLLSAAHGPAGTRDYRIAVQARPDQEGTVLQIHSSYRPSLSSTLLTRSYLATLGRDKVGFSRVTEGGGLVQGMRGVIERNVVRYQLAIDSFLTTQSLPLATRHETALSRWFALNEHYAQQLHEMDEAEYLAIKRREWQNQQRLQQSLDEKVRMAVR